jgi:PAS domain S-box-containing protein
MTTSAKSLVDHGMDYAIGALGPDGTIQSWSAGAERLKGYTREEALGQNFSVFYTTADQQAGRPQQILAEATTGSSVAHTGWRVRKDGTQFWGEIVITALHDDDGVLTGFLKVTRDLTEQHRVEKELKNADERLRILVNSVVDYAIIALSVDGVIESWNIGAERLKGYTFEEAVGRHFSMFYPAEDRRVGVPQRSLDEARAAGNVEHTGWRVRKDGSRFWAGVAITALYDNDGVLTGYVKVTRDRSALRQLEAAQDTFYNAFEHDIRIPLTAIKGFAELARDSGRVDRLRFLDRVDTNTNRILGMLEELVDYARLRDGQVAIKIENVDVAGLTRQVVESLVSGGSRVSVGQGTAAVLADRAALQRVIANVLNNALKYSDSDTEVVCSAELFGDHGVLRIVDQGRGIDDRDLAWIFDEFERGRLATRDAGTGLGLASARQLIRLQGGTITIDSKVGVGTTVTIRLPFA